MTPIASFTVAGVDFVVLPRSALARLRASELPPTERELLAQRVRAAREHAGLTQTQLAKLLDVTQPMVCASEKGRSQVGADYLARVLEACGLPEGWKPRAKRAKRTKGRAKGSK